MIKVTALTSGRDVPSSRFRVRQFIEPLKKFGIQVSELYPLISKYASPAIVKSVPAKVSAPAKRFRFLLTAAKLTARVPGLVSSRFADVTWLERELVPGKRTLEWAAGRKCLFDVDDAIWIQGDPGFSENIVSRCYGVIAGNDFLADHYKKYCARIWVVPTSVDTDRWRPAIKSEKRKWTIGWTGTAGNLEYLYGIEEPLNDFLGQHSDAELLIVCDREPNFRIIAPSRWRFHRWSSQQEIYLTQQMDVGLMPLPDTEWARGKCGFKMLLYMAVGIPVIVSLVGVNREILEKGKVGFGANDLSAWFDALKALFDDRVMAGVCGAEGRRVVEREYSIDRNAPLLADIFHEAASQ